MRKLIILTPGTTRRREDGCIRMTSKTLSGLRAYAEYWPGETIWITPEESRHTDSVDGENLGSQWIDPNAENFCYMPASNPISTVRSFGTSAIVVALLRVSNAQLLTTGARVVYISEQSLQTRIGIQLAGKPPASERLRIFGGAVKEELLLRRLVRRADGLQANGWPTWLALHRESPSPLLFFDTRLRTDQLPSRGRTRRPPDGPLRLGFSGRHIPIKGPQHAVQLARDLQEAGIPCTLDIFGTGPMEPDLRREAGEGVKFHGDVSFDRDWVPFVRDAIDLMVLPHVQGDPAGTYLETAGLGVPVIGFDNEALRTLTKEAAFGWVVPMRDRKSLLHKVAELAADGESLTAASANGIAFMRKHSFEQEFRRRVEHLRQIAGD